MRSLEVCSRKAIRGDEFPVATIDSTPKESGLTPPCDGRPWDFGAEVGEVGE